MIEQFYIDSAKSIRSEFISLSQQLKMYEEDLRNISKVMLDTAKELEEYRDNGIDKEDNVETVKNYIVSKLDYLETQSNILAKKIDPINLSIDKLKVEELTLYKNIKSKYPNISDSKLKEEIHKRINE